MKKVLFILLFIMLLFPIYGQIIVSGIIINKTTKETVIGANIRNISRKVGCSSNRYGFFSIKLSQLPDTLVFSHIGFKSDTIIILKSTDTLKIELEESKTNISAFEVVAENPLINSTSMGVVKISTKQLKQLPTLGGEADAIKAFQMMPGVQSGNEGSSSLLVRGGSPDQTLILLDDVPIYYINHIGGFLSTIDVNTINEIKLIKGGFPAEYGNRLSGIMDIRLKNGNKQKHNVSMELGLISTKLFAEGPINKGKTTYMLSVRRCNFDLMSRLFFSVSDQYYSAGYTFYDAYAKITHTFNSKNTISISAYNGRDKVYNNLSKPYEMDPDRFINKGKMNTTWGNTLFSAKYNHQFSNRLFSSTTVGHSHFNYASTLESYQLEIATKAELYKSTYFHNSGIDDLLVKQDFDFFVKNKFRIKMGASFTNHSFNLGIYETSNPQNETKTGENIVNSQEFDIFEQNEIEFKHQFRANIGIHLNGYFVEGESFYSIQPRINISKSFKKTNSIKLSYAIMQQNMHLLSNNGVGVPVDLWVPATKRIVPQKSNQLSLGYYKIFGKNKYEFSSEIYYKKLINQIDYKEGINIFSNDFDWEHKVAVGGEGQSTGLEFLLQKKHGRLNGWVAYTLSYNYRKFDQLNNGDWYPYKYDRRHVFTIVGNYQISKNITLSSDFVFMTGNAITLPVGKYQNINLIGNYFVIPQETTYIYNGRNGSRMPKYHRLDLSLSFKKDLKRGSREWIISIYNVYSHNNAYYLYFTQDIKGNFHLNQMSLFPIVPSVLFKRIF